MPDKASVTDRHPGWFVESKGKPLAGDLPSRHASTPRWLIGLTVPGVALLILGSYFALVPWSGCGISVMGRYDHSSPPDSAATAFTACWNQAQGRRIWAGVSCALGLVALALIVILTWSQSRRST